MADVPIPETEEWRTIDVRPDYQISSLGRVRRATPSRGVRVGEIIKPFIKSASSWVRMGTNGRSFRVGALVYAAFCGAQLPSNWKVVYADNDPLNNALDNLTWEPIKRPDALIRHRVKDAAIHRARRAANPEFHRAQGRLYYARTKEHQNALLRPRRRARYATDPQYKLSIRLRVRLVKALNGSRPALSAVRDLGCSLDEFRRHIERQFLKGMSWQNWGRYAGKWHLDHIIPLGNLDLTDPEQLRVALHFTNYRPLWSTDNLRKHDRRELLL